MFVGYVELYTMLQYLRYGYTKKKPNKQKKRFFSYIGPCDNILLVFEIFVPTNLAIDKRVNNMH